MILACTSNFIFLQLQSDAYNAAYRRKDHNFIYY